MRLTALVIVLLGIGAQPGLAADTKAARRAAARTYMALPGVQAGLDACIDAEPMQAEVNADLVRRGVPPADRAKVKAAFVWALSELRPVIVEKSLAAMTTTYTVGEIEAMEAFVRTPAGAAIQRKSCAYMNALLTELAPLNAKIEHEITLRLRRGLR